MHSAQFHFVTKHISFNECKQKILRIKLCGMKLLQHHCSALFVSNMKPSASNHRPSLHPHQSSPAARQRHVYCHLQSTATSPQKTLQRSAKMKRSRSRTGVVMRDDFWHSWLRHFSLMPQRTNCRYTCGAHIRWDHSDWTLTWGLSQSHCEGLMSCASVRERETQSGASSIPAAACGDIIWMSDIKSQICWNYVSSGSVFSDVLWRRCADAPDRFSCKNYLVRVRKRSGSDPRNLILSPRTRLKLFLTSLWKYQLCHANKLKFCLK